jgi:hypothetical protein
MRSKRFTLTLSDARFVRWQKAARSRDLSVAEWLRQAGDKQAELDRYHAFQRQKQGREVTAIKGVWPSGVPKLMPCPEPSCVNHGNPHQFDPAIGHGWSPEKVKAYAEEWVAREVA